MSELASSPSARARVLVARLDGAGDVLLAGPAVRAVAASAEVTMLVGPAGREAAGLLPGVADVQVWTAPWIVTPAPPVRAADIDDLIERSRGFDEAVLLTSYHQSPLPMALLLRLAGVPKISGASVDHPGSLLDVRLRPGEGLPEDIPEPERALEIAAAAGFALPPGDDGRLAITAPPRGPGNAEIVLHPGAAVTARRWPAEHFAELAAHLGPRAAVTGGPDERALTAAVAGDSALDLGGATTLAELAGVLARARAVVTGNTSAAHLAAAVGTPVVSLFAPVVPAVRWAPYGVPHVLLGDQHAPCRDTRARVCPVPGHPCLTGVSPADVLAALDDLIRTREAA